MDHENFKNLIEAIVFVFLIVTFLIGYIVHLRHKRILKKLAFNESENDKKRQFDKEQANLNQVYRQNALENDYFKQVVQALSVKTEDKSNPDQKVTHHKIDLNLLNDVLHVKNELLKPK